MNYKTTQGNVSSVKKHPFKGHVYNVTTETGNLFVEDILVHNSGGLGTPPHLRIEPGMIHRSSGGVLFLDEIATLSPKAQQELLTAMQEKKYSITGQSEMSSGAMTRTEAVPCFPSGTLIATENGLTAIDEFVNRLFESRAGQVNREGYAEFLDLNDSIKIWVPKDNGIFLDMLERVYRRPFSGKLMKIIFDDGTELLATKEHPIKTPADFVQAKDLSLWQEVEAIQAIISDVKIMETYSKENQRIAKAYAAWKANPLLKARGLGVDCKTIAAWKKGTVPRASRCIDWLGERGLFPLLYSDPRLPLIARISGALFGDGGLTRTGVFFSTDSNSLADLEMFKRDLLQVFGTDLSSNFVFRKTTSLKGSGLEVSAHNAFISRFFSALGVPVGSKVPKPIAVPLWINFSAETKKEFFSALLSCEMCGKIKNASDKISFVMAKVKRFEKQHLAFLNEIRAFLSENGVETSKITATEYTRSKGGAAEKAARYSFTIFNNYKNVMQFEKAVQIHYASRKAQYMKKRFGKAVAYSEDCVELGSNKAKALELRASGLTINEIGRRIMLSKNTIMKTVGPTYRHYSSMHKRTASDLLNAGLTLKRAARELEMPYTTLLYWKKAGDLNV
ncbi:MAG: sigma 54-interacting transcriptional regulator [Candidatus Diapherotrites archaeon]